MWWSGFAIWSIERMAGAASGAPSGGMVLGLMWLLVFGSGGGRRKRRPYEHAVLGLIAAFGPASAQEEVFGDPEFEKPPTKAYREAVRIKGVGVKIGEVTANSAILWVRVPPPEEVGYERNKDAMAVLRSLFRGDDNFARYRLGTSPDLAGAEWSEWAEAEQSDDFCHQWNLENLAPYTRYYFEVEGIDPQKKPLYEKRRGQFRTAPAAGAEEEVTFTVITGKRYDRLDDPKGFLIYDAMRRLNSDFLVATGDSVYLDRGPLRARNLELARDRWRRTFELPRLFDFYTSVPVYFEKDDHDILRDDVTPASKPLGKLTFADGLAVFREHTPHGDLPYRTVRWGKFLQIWLTEVREFRSENKEPDGPGKSIYGERQLQWLKSTLAASDAAWKVLINPTPIVGPDRKRLKRDNHANTAWSHEGEHIRRWFAERLGGRFLIISGDRHWQYHSVHPQWGLDEYACGPATDEHAGGSPGFNRDYHRFHRVGGGFLSLTAGRAGDEAAAVIRLHAVDGEVVYEDRKTRNIE